MLSRNNNRNSDIRKSKVFFILYFRPINYSEQNQINRTNQNHLISFQQEKWEESSVKEFHSRVRNNKLNIRPYYQEMNRAWVIGITIFANPLYLLENSYLVQFWVHQEKVSAEQGKPIMKVKLNFI